ncbi:MAG: AmmeMemoRadiSam system protein B [Elusimicrobiales bacterium]|nr:AmmeMemoRadiSam system protein B [Elusimicrobiales bacterium]
MKNLPLDPSAPLPPFRRAIDAAMVEHQGEPMLLLRDTEGIAEQAMLVSPAALLLITLLDGKNSLSDIKALIMKHTGAVMPENSLAGLVEEFGKLSFLETPEVSEKRRRAAADFKAASVRKPALAGLSYPEDPLELSKFIGSLLNGPDGPGLEFAARPVYSVPPSGLVAPHIDLARGAGVYARTYQELSKFPPPDVIVAVGVAHAEPASPWVFTAKSYRTPYGDMAVDMPLYNALAGGLWYDPAADEMAHKTEHSLEFQALWLKYLWRDKAPAWVPVLVSAFERFSPDKPPRDVKSLEDGFLKMEAILAGEVSKGRRVMVLAAVDLFHVGPRFGDKADLTKEARAKREADDKTALGHCFRLDADGFYKAVADGGNPRHICGLSALYTATRLLRACAPQTKGRLLAYGSSPDPTGGAVSFAGAIFDGKSGDDGKLD